VREETAELSAIEQMMRGRLVIVLAICGLSEAFFLMVQHGGVGHSAKTTAAVRFGKACGSLQFIHSG